MSLKAAVSLGKRRRKYAQLGTDLDLAYLTPTLIAMGFPCPSLPKTLYRNSINQALKFPDSKHGPDHYFVFNLCSEPGWSYPSNSFHGNYVQYPFDDHQPPPFHLLLQILHHIHTWLQRDPRNIAAVHCKAEKGRTGVIRCAYLLLTRVFQDADAVLAGYTRLRMLEGWGDGLTVAGAGEMGKVF
ncbi:protein-tyrosine phosphatase-like protein [Chytriomyces cf. hyalinus JEL632]|nr:protein-tyrosine phosphatase-like protein [Chytriomyces cf. hyalinus JEL632]